MDCKTTSSNKSKAALTLVEMLVAIGVGSIVFTVLGSLALYSARSFSSMVNYSDLNKENRQALDEISQVIRQSRGLSKRTDDATYISFFTSGTNKVSYTYDKNAKTVTERKPGENPKTILKNCIVWTNEIFQKTPPQGSTNFTRTPDFNLCKMVEFRWTCDSGTSSSGTNSQNVHSMKVVIRKKPD